jgi:predicted nucleotidyltransferase
MARDGQSRKASMRSRVASGRAQRQLSARTSVPPPVLKDIIARIVTAARPDRIILFGSGARGTMGPDSDVDLLVIKAGRFDRGRLTERIYLSLQGAGEAVDIIVVTPEDVERYRDTPWLVIAPALMEGKVVYAA